MSFSYQPPAARLRLLKAMNDSLMFAPREVIASICETLLPIMGPSLTESESRGGLRRRLT